LKQKNISGALKKFIGNIMHFVLYANKFFSGYIHFKKHFFVQIQVHAANSFTPRNASNSEI